MPKDRMTGGDIVVRALEDEGIPYTFGIPGTHNIELYDSIARSDRVRPVLVTDEQSASFMADGVSRSSGHLGCVNLVPGAGFTHAMSGIAEAFLDGIPMLVLACGIRTDSDKSFQLHDVDQLAIARPVTKAQLRPAEGSEIYSAVRRACRIARTPPAGPALVEIPVNHYLFKHEPRFDSWFLDSPPEPLPVAGEGVLQQVESLLAKSQRPLLYVGLGAAAAGEDLVALAERLQAPVSTTFQGKGIFPESHPLWLWCGFGDAAPGFVRDVAGSCDLTLAIGCRFAEVGTGSYGLEPPGPLIHVDVDPDVIGRNYPTELGVAAESGALVEALLERLPPRERDDDLHRSLTDGHAKVDAELQGQEGERVSPPRLLRALQEIYGPETIYCTDSGNGTFLAIESLRLDRPRSFLAPVDYSCMGYSVPASLGAALACPDRPAVALAGDGAFLMTGLELLTAAHVAIPASIFVLRDRELAQIAQFQQTALARKTASELPDYELEDLCRGVGVDYRHLVSDAEITDTLSEARAIHASGRPVLVEVEIDYSAKTYFTRGVVRTNLGRLPWPERLRFLSRALIRRIPGVV